MAQVTDLAMQPEVQHFYHEQTGTLSYVVSDPETSAAAVIDPVLGFSVVSGRTESGPVDEIVACIAENKLQLTWILETHAHADHLSGAQVLKSRLGGKVGIGEGIRKVQEHFGPVFNLQAPFAADGHQFDHLFGDNETFALGNIECRVMHTPGHTSDSVTYLIGKYAFIGDSMFNVDFGTARCDFPGGDAALLYDSIQKLLALPDDTILCLCHDYPPESRSLRSEVTVKEQKDDNIHVGGGKGRDEFVTVRKTRDDTLSLPALILPAIQVNIQAGHLPESESNEISYIKIPLDTL
jgi:glyoxylase-like metal-dependent hydrolase (beta-lactamase superfamily II)